MKLSEAVVNEIWDGNKIAAIKLLREEKGLGLKEAKDTVDEYIRNDTTLNQKFQQQSAKTQRGCLMWMVIIGGLAFWVYSYYSEQII